MARNGSKGSCTARPQYSRSLSVSSVRPVNPAMGSQDTYDQSRFRQRGRHGRARCRNLRLERRQFRAAKASGEVKQVACVLAEALNSQSPTGRLQSEAVSCILVTVGTLPRPPATAV